jgi:hypothetical protein
MKKVNAIVNQFPSGNWGFVGWLIPGELLFSDPPEAIAKAHAAGCTQFLKHRVYATQAEAQAALDAWLAANPQHA